MAVAEHRAFNVPIASGRISGAELGWSGWGGDFLGGSDESSAGEQLARDKARRGTADGAIIAREEGEEWRN